jgi:hypothetical protein
MPRLAVAAAFLGGISATGAGQAGLLPPLARASALPAAAMSLVIGVSTR